MEVRNEKAKLIQNIYPLTSLQEGMLFHYLSAPDSQGYILQDCFFVEYPLEENLVNDSLELLSMKHDVLRTSIIYEKVKEPVQVVYKNRPIEFSIEDHSSLSEEEFKQKVQENLAADLSRGFDLQKDTLVRFKFLRHTDSFMIVVTMHHIIIDGWCANMVIGGFLSFYQLLSDKVPKAEIQQQITAEREGTAEFVDFVKWQTRQDKRKAQSYWNKLLDGYDSAAKIEPLTSHVVSDEQMNKRLVSIDGEAGRKIADIVSEEKVTYNVFAESLFGILLQQCMNEKDVVFGKIVSGRNANINGIENIMGLFVNTIPVRVVTQKGTTVRELIRMMHEQSIESSNYDFCSLAEIQNSTKQGSELINVLFAFENYASGTEGSAQADEGNSESPAVSMSYTREQTEYSITITSFFTNNTLMFSIMYDPSLYLPEEIDRLAGRLERICHEIVMNPDIPVDSLSMATQQEEQLILNDFNATETNYPRDKTVVELFEEQVRKTPNNIALVFGDTKLTYAELNTRANSLGHKLRALGVKPDDLVAIVADRSIEMITGIYAILKAGGAYVPIDPTYPEDRIAFILEDCAAKAILKFTTENVELGTGAPIIDLSKSEVWEGASGDPEHINKPNDLIYAIYTSGTTGKPKGSLIENRSVIRLVKNTNYIELDEHKVILQTGSMSFDASTLEVWGAFLNGGKLVICTQDVITDSVKLRAVMAKEKVNTMWLTSTLFNQMISEENDIFDNLEHLLIGGEKLSDDHVRIMKSRNNGVTLTNGYGPTESTTFATTYDIPAGFEMIPIGKPIANTKIYMMNGTKLCGIGVPGELCIAGDGLARGYLNRPELTAEKFIDNPYGEGRIYRTGDLARWLPDGNIEYLGRIDEQVKIRGFRIELGEIESKIREIDNVKDCAVIAKADASGDKAIYAYYTGNSEVHVEDIREKLRESLPEYMVPAYMMQIDEIPITRNGKLDRRALPEIETKNTGEYVAPQNEVEEAVCTAFREVLNVERVGRQDSFFELGGDSIKAIRIISKLRNAGYSLTVRDVMTEKLVKRIAAKLMEPDEPSVEEKEAESNISEQQAYYLENRNSVLCRSIMVSLSKLDLNKVKDAITWLMLGNTIFRTFIDGEKTLIDDYVYNDAFSISEYKNNKDLFEQCDRIEEEITKRIGNMVRFALFYKKREYRLFICGHPSVIDTPSLFTLLSEFILMCQKTETQYISGITMNAEKANRFLSVKNVNKDIGLKDTDITKNTAWIKESIDNKNISFLSWREHLTPGFKFDEVIASLIMETVKEALYRDECEVTIISDGTNGFEGRHNFDMGFYEQAIRHKENNDSAGVMKIIFSLTNVQNLISLESIGDFAFKDVFLQDDHDVKISVIAHENGADLYVTYNPKLISKAYVTVFTSVFKAKFQHLISDSVGNYLDYSLDLSDRCNKFFKAMLAYNAYFTGSEYSNERVTAPCDFLKSMGRGDERNLFYPVDKKYSINQIVTSLVRIIYDQPSMRCCYDFEKNDLAVYNLNKNITLPLFKLLYDEQAHDLIEGIGTFIREEKMKNQRSVLSWLYILELSDKYLVVLNVSHAVWDGMCDDIFGQLLEDYLNGGSSKSFALSEVQGNLPMRRDFSYFVNSLVAFSSSTDTQILSQKLAHYTVKVNVSNEKADAIQRSPLSWGVGFICEVLRRTGIITKETLIPMFIIHHNRNAHNSMKLGCVCDAIPMVYNKDNVLFEKMFEALVYGKKSGEIYMNQVDELLSQCNLPNMLMSSPIVVNYHGTHSSQAETLPFKITIDEQQAEQQNFLFLDFDMHDSLVSLDFNSTEKKCKEIGMIINEYMNS